MTTKAEVVEKEETKVELAGESMWLEQKMLWKPAGILRES